MIDIHELERQLAGDSGPGAERGAPDLTRIRRLGRRRRRTRTALVGGAAALVLAGALGVGVLAAGDGDGSGRDPDVANSTKATDQELSDIAQRALEEIPGARRISDTQVAIPGPADDPRMFAGVPVEVVGMPVSLPEPYYDGVTYFPRDAMAPWLYDATLEAEQADLQDDGSQPSGTTELTGVYVDVGPRYLACILPLEIDFPADPDAPCQPVLLSGGWAEDGDRREDLTYEAALGTDQFLRPGSPMEVYLDVGSVDGAEATLAVGGMAGTDVARVEFITTDGKVVGGAIAGDDLTGPVVEGATFFYAEVPGQSGELERVIAYDVDGQVIEDHPLDCDPVIECKAGYGHG